MRCFALVAGLFLALLAQAPAPARAQTCTDFDSHGHCLACAWYYDAFTLHPGEVAQPFSCANMGRDRQARLVIGGLGTYLGPDGAPGALDHRIAVKIGSRYVWSRRSWGPNTATMPVGPTTVPLGPVADGAVVAPNLQLTMCSSRLGGPGACHFAVSAKICLSHFC